MFSFIPSRITLRPRLQSLIFLSKMSIKRSMNSQSAVCVLRFMICPTSRRTKRESCADTVRPLPGLKIQPETFFPYWSENRVHHNNFLNWQINDRNRRDSAAQHGLTEEQLLLFDLLPEPAAILNVRENKLVLVKGERARSIVATER